MALEWEPYDDPGDPGTPEKGTQQMQPTETSMNNPLVVAYGMGVDSTAMLVGLWKNGERPDAILFADTGDEKPETYAYLPIVNEWLESVGFPRVTVVKNA